MFKLDYLPPFYFTYWIITLAIISITHEFSHGIFMKRYGIRIKSTGFGFLGPFLAAFVEQDEKQMKKKGKFEQIAVLSAGTFANVLTAILFLVVLWIFFANAFVPSGIVFDTYSYSLVGIQGVSSVNNIILNNATYEKMIALMNNDSLNEIKTKNNTYFITKADFAEQKGYDYIVLYDDSPALKNELTGAITEFNGVKINNKSILETELKKYSPGDKITITTKTANETKKYEIILEGRPENKSVAWLGIGFLESKSNGIIGKIYSTLSYFKEKGVYYEPRYEIYSFIYDLLWWIILISLSVALVNMLPVGIFDGGMVFYLTLLGITKNEKISKKIFSIITYLFLFLLLVLMILWAFSFR
jgi:membrane-associated protease RseP (regulator of RpoE activity)